MDLSVIDAHLLEFPLVEPFAASHGTTTARTLVAIRLEARGVEGWGECSALPAATYTAESAAGCFELLADRILPELIEGDDEPSDALDRLRREHDAPMALAALEMALLDLGLTGAGRSLADHLGAARGRVPAGVSLGLDRPAAVADKAADLVDEGYRRLKVKIQPDHDLEVLALVRDRLGPAGDRVEIQLDANGAYGPDGVDLLVELARSGAGALEQPLAPTEVDAAAELVERLGALAEERGDRPVPVVADEAVATLADAEALADRRAMTGISIKPARVGGLDAARALHDLCRARGLAATAGGMLESGLGRHALAALAALPGFDLTGDLSPAGRWLGADAWPDLEFIDGWITVPSGPGVAPAPDPRRLLSHSIEHRRWER